MTAPTWRANPDWGNRLGYDAKRLAEVNRHSIEFLEGLRERYAETTGPIVISGNIGPRGDGYLADQRMSAAAYFMVNCAHPEHFEGALQADEAWTARVRAVRANASRMSHDELDNAEALDDGDPREFGRLYRRLRERFSHISVLGGCCGTDHRHLQEVRRAVCAPAA